MERDSILVVAILVPALAGLICYLASRKGQELSPIVALTGAICAFILCIAIFARGSFAYNRDWISVDGFAISISLASNRLTSFIALGVSFFGLAITLYSVGWMAGNERRGRFFAMTMVALSSAIGAVFSDHLILFLIFWEVGTVALFLLANLGKMGSEKGAAKSFVMLGFSDCAMLLGIALLWGTGSVPSLRMSELAVRLGSPVTYAAYLLMLTGALAKAGAFPLHTWIPSMAETAPAPVMAYLPASLDKLLGIYLLARLSLQMFTLDTSMKIVLVIIGAVTILFAVMMALVQHDFKKLLSYHAVSQVGYMVLGIGTGTVVGVIGGLFHMVNNALYKSCLFMGAGAVESRTGTSDLDRLGGLARAMPITFASSLVAALAISGVPPLNGFASKWMVYQSVLEFGKENTSLAGLAPWLLIAAVFGSALTLASFVKVIHSVFWGARPAELAEEKIKEVGFPLWMPMAVLAALCILFGVWAQLPVAKLLVPVLNDLKQTGPEGISANAAPLEFVTGIWSPVAATLLLILGLILGLIIFAIGRGMKFRTARPFIAGEILEPDETRLAASDFYESIRGLPGFNTVYKDADAGAYDVYHLGGKYGLNIVEMLRGFHTGRLPVYISWCIAGLVAMVIAVICFM